MIRVYGSERSYYTGKLEAYLRYKEIPYTRVAMTSRLFERTVPERTGVAQMPAIALDDGRWLTDSTPIIAWFEARHPTPAVIPTDPVQAYVSRLLEDYADEWLWRPAMHYRWSYAMDARLASHGLAVELLSDRTGPLWLKREVMRRRQVGRFVRGDGVTAQTRSHVEGIYLRTLDALDAITRGRPFLLGDVPTLVDFGFFASMFRHFALDPTPGAIMRLRAPNVFAWVARVWSARASRSVGALHPAIPDDWAPLLDDVGAAYLPYLCANAEAWKARRRRFDVAVQGAPYRNLPTSHYRVWCLEELRRHHDVLPEPARVTVRAILERHGIWEPLWRVPVPGSGHDPDGRAPFGPLS